MTFLDVLYDQLDSSNLVQNHATRIDLYNDVQQFLAILLSVLVLPQSYKDGSNVIQDD